MPGTSAGTVDARRCRQAAVLLVVAAIVQLVGQALLRLPSGETPGTVMWTAAHVVLVLGAIGLLAAMAGVARVVGPGAGTWLGLVLLVVGQLLTLAVLGIDLGLATAPVEVVRTLDTWDFLALVVLAWTVHHLRTRNPVPVAVGV